jgi:adenine-specific DNA-methyltransferase
MNTLNYIGCKYKLFERLYGIFVENIPDLKDKTFSDLFMGTGIVSFNMIGKCKAIHANDLESYSYVIGKALLNCPYTERLQQLIVRCNELDGVEGLIYKHYSPNAECERMFFTSENAKKADAIRQYIETLEISREEYYFLLASLLVSIDKVANTACVYGAYLKEFKASSLKKMVLEPIHKNTDLEPDTHHVTQDYAESVEVKSDVTYLDPPYNQRSYSANYFVLNFIVKYDESIVPRGKTGLIDKNQSMFCSKAKIKQAFSDLLGNINSRYVLLSYNNEGLLNEEELREILSKRGSLKLYKILYNKFKASKKVSGDFVYEYLWVLDTLGEKEFQIIESR